MPPIPLNFRDLGGAPASNGRVACGRLFRSAQLSGLDEESATYLQATLGVGAYIDFRVEKDILRDGAPTALLARGVRWHRHPFDISDATFEALTLPRAQDWRALYARAFERLRPELSGAIRLIALTEVPVVFGCWAGKDRTGMVAALTLALLGVDEQWIADDFAQTEAALLKGKDRFSFLWQERPHAEAEIVAAHLGTKRESILGFLSDVRERFGSLSRAVQLPESVQVALSTRYLEPT